MTQEELEKKQSECAYLACEIARLRKIINIKQSAFNKVDKELYEHYQKEKQNESQLSTN